MSYVASITTHPPRFESFLQALESINKQQIRPEHLVINIANKDKDLFEKEVLGEIRQNYTSEYAVVYCEDLRPGNKIFYTANYFTNTHTIITFDDDIYYPEDRSSILLEFHEKYPNNPIAYRCHQVTFKRKKLITYSLWPVDYESNGPDYLNFATSVSGNLYPQGIFKENFFDFETYKKLTYTDDDIWMYFYMIGNKTPFVRAAKEHFSSVIKGSQDCGLWKTNYPDRYDVHFANMENEFGSIYKLTKKYR